MRVKSTRNVGPVDQPGMSIEEIKAMRPHRPLGMREVAGSNPARSTTMRSLFKRIRHKSVGYEDSG